MAILIQSLGKEAAQKINLRLSDAEKEMIDKNLAQMGKIPPQLVEKVAHEFIMNVKGESASQNDNLSNRNSDKDEENNPQKSVSQSSGLMAFQALEAEQIIELIKDEHPQTISVILSQLNPSLASEILADFPEEKKSDVAMRIASLENVMDGVIEELDAFFDDVLKKRKTTQPEKAGGIDSLAQILNQLDGASVQFILDDIEERDQELVEQIKQKMFIFDDLKLVDDKGLQKLLRSVETKDLATALKGASEEVKQKIFQNISERAGDILKEEIESLGAVRMKDVEDAQQAMTKIIQDMETKGEVIITGRGGEKLIA